MTEQTTKIAFSNMALTQKIPGSDKPMWGRLIKSFDNYELPSIDIINFIYTGHPFTTWHNGDKKGENFILGQHIALDFDTRDERSSLSTLASDRFIAKYANAIYTTPSHTEKEPRARVLFLLDTPIHQPENYLLAVRTMLWLFPAADKNCQDVTRTFNGSMNCDVAYMPDQYLPLSVMRDLIPKYIESGKIAKRRFERTYTTTVNPGSAEEFDRVCQALNNIDAWSIDYKQWVGVIAAMKRTFGPMALSATIAWGQGKDGEVEKKWHELREDAAKTMTIATIFYLAAGGR